jgi:DNA-binding NarL/FixJ family response regulator
MPRAQILLADDHELFREGLCGLINSQTDLIVAGQAADGLEALTLARDLQPDLIVMDIKMPICDGLEATRLIRRERPEARIIILTVHDEDAKLFEAVKAGACGYILKSTKSANFLQSVRAALVGDAVLPPRLAGRLLQEFARLANNPIVNSATLQTHDLTPRESEVLQLIAAGATDKEIAQDLSLSLHTVKSHVRNILGKLHAVNRRQAANIALNEGWVRKPSE